MLLKDGCALLAVRCCKASELLSMIMNYNQSLHNYKTIIVDTYYNCYGNTFIV